MMHIDQSATIDINAH